MTNKYRQHFESDFPCLVNLACKTNTAQSFCQELAAWAKPYACNDQYDRLHLMIRYNDREIDEFSTRTKLLVQTITLLRLILRKELPEDPYTKMLEDLLQMFRALVSTTKDTYDREDLKRDMMRWETGLDADVDTIRKENKRRIIECIISRLETRPTSHYFFNKDMSHADKAAIVSRWWETSAFHLAMAVRDPNTMNKYLGYTLSTDTMTLLETAKAKGMPFFVSPYYLSLLNINDTGYNDAAIRSYIIYSEELVQTYGTIRAWEREDTVCCNKPNAAGWLLPNEKNIHRRYPEVAILIPDSMGRACGGLCASCQRMYDFQSKRLNFELEALTPEKGWKEKLHDLLHYFEQDTQLRDILITGGDALMSQDSTLEYILEEVFQMALRKKNANKQRKEGEKYAEIVRVRLGSRLLAYLPQRITPELTKILRTFCAKAKEIGITQCYIQTHFQTPLEITPEARQAIERIIETGWTITNQLVYTVASSPRGHAARLRQELNQLGVFCYYTFSVKGFNENHAVFTPLARSLQEQYEEKSHGKLDKNMREALDELIKLEPAQRDIKEFLRQHDLPFLATDRSVLNLPGIGKSLTFKTIGITPEGRRILRFEHDTSRKHSPIIAQISDLYIVTNKSIYTYMKDLSEMGEDPARYASVWNYWQGVTEPRLSLYEYPPYEYEETKRVSNYRDCKL